MGEDGPKVIYRTRIRVRTAVLVVAFLVLQGVYGYTSERYPDAQKQAARQVVDNRQVTPTPETSVWPSSSVSTSSIPASSTDESGTPSTTGTEQTGADRSSDGDTGTSTSTGGRPKLTTTSVPGIPVPIPRITTEDGEETTTAEESSAP
ncbi:hypothetical protein GII33_16325 [Gordonia pseudamarae]|jgi:hypothetical protein|uniref:Uncharacterized protein n=1 Tax=Gordonia pseudamarae TaxID=2831662 RepID=A0ABX6IKI7_9ACTN|nr:MULTISPECIES: hypothetical protein [Gordonia]MBD0024410.1 hypothetical protein [Gordonia sp. (in: high G+C Gram-positive bacteria)]QHN27282.1 hypothetical protein GII33_16325 [Gordonia pseudamarae]QHN36166.1 hypothetical protein GII31_16100 [Gordonia pseudamarae]